MKPGTLAGYRSIVSVLNQEFGSSAIESFTPEFFERWKGGFAEKRKLSNRGVQRYLVALHSIFKRAMNAYGLPRNPLATVERPRVARKAGIDVFSREEVMALVRAAQDDQDGVLYLTPPSPACASESCSGFAGRTSTSTPPRSASAATGPTAARAHPRVAAIVPSR